CSLDGVVASIASSVQTRRSARLAGIGKADWTTAAQQEESRGLFSLAQMLKRHCSRCRGPAAYWSGGIGS
ncbi:MAG TPA: hypothetical protein VH642_13525, partial [Streptosporangiaceae bacterium]